VTAPSDHNALDSTVLSRYNPSLRGTTRCPRVSPVKRLFGLGCFDPSGRDGYLPGDGLAELIGAFDRGMIEKRELLVFDRFATVKSRLFKWSDEWNEELPPSAIPHEWLLDRGLLLTFDDDFENTMACQAVQAAMAEWRAEGERLFARHEGEPMGTYMFSPESLAWQDNYTRVFALALREVEKLNAVPLTGESPQPADLISRVGDVLHFVVKSLPQPDDRIPPEDIIAFREEARALGLIDGLMSWVDETASGGLSALEVSERLTQSLACSEPAKIPRGMEYLVKARERFGG
jgi:hypothetical protein